MVVKLHEQCLQSELVFAGKVIRLKVDQVRLPDGKTSKREVVVHPGAVAVLPITEQGNLLLIRQYRYSADEVLWEVPAGKLEPDEDPELAAARELAEEVGFLPGELVHRFSMFTAPGFCNELLHLYQARNLRPHEAECDADEFIEVAELDREEVRQLLASGKVRDAKTLVALLDYLSA